MFAVSALGVARGAAVTAAVGKSPPAATTAKVWQAYPAHCKVQVASRRCLTSTAAVRQEAQAAATSSQSRKEGDGDDKKGRFSSFFSSTGWETAMGASVGVLLLGFAAMGYQSWYKERVLRKMVAAFDPGYDPVLILAKTGDQLAHISVDPPREEEDLINSIVQGKEAGRYFLALGSKGAGKATMIIEAMNRIDADGCAMFEAHSDSSIVVDRFSESINYAMNRDYLGALLGLNDLSGLSPFQSLERGLHKLERALIRRKAATGKPAVIVMNNAHLLPRDEEGQKLLHLFQQRAERWASAGTATFLFCSNDYWVYDALRKASNRMDTLTFKDLSRKQSHNVLRGCRSQYWKEDPEAIDEKLLDEVYQIVGGRIALLNRVARRKDMARAAQQLVEDDVRWLQSKTGIIVDHDDDVMDEQKWSTCSWLLFVELGKRQEEMEKEQAAHWDSLAQQDVAASLASVPEEAPNLKHPPDTSVTDPSRDHDPPASLDVPNPSLTWGEARQVMTRPDFIMELDHLNIVQIDRHHLLRADSMPLLRAFRRVSEEPGYEEKLEAVMDRVSAIESLGRTRELVWKEQGEKGKFLIRKDEKGRERESWTLLGGDERLGREEGEEAE